MMRPYYIRVPFEGDNIVELIQFGDSGGHNEIKFGEAKAKQAMTYYARNDISIDGERVCKEIEVSDEVERGDRPAPDQLNIPGLQLSEEKIQKLVNGSILINGRKLPDDYKIDAFGGKF
jgi:hypothetical protein